jgi:hypothetical protein
MRLNTNLQPLSRRRLARALRKKSANPIRGISLALATTIGAALAWSYTEFVKPSIAPVNVSVDLSVKRDTASKDDMLVPLATAMPLSDRSENSNKVTPIMIELEIESKSQHRAIDLFNSIFVIYGMNVVDPSSIDPSKVKTDNLKDFFNKAVGNHEKPISIGLRRVKDLYLATDLLSYGSLFGSTIMESGEKLQANRIVPIPYRVYDFVQVRVYVPTGLRPSGLSSFIGSLLSKPMSVFDRRLPEEARSSVNERIPSNASSGPSTSSLDNDITVDYEFVETHGTKRIMSYFCDAKNLPLMDDKSVQSRSQPCGNFLKVASQETISRLDLQSKVLVKELWLDNDKN